MYRVVRRPQKNMTITLPDELASCEAVYIEFRDASSKTERQNRAFHALVRAFALSGYSSYNFEELKGQYKLAVDLVAYYVYSYSLGGSIHATPSITEVPEGVAYVRVPIPASWQTATKAQASGAIRLLLSDIIDSGASVDPEVQKILKGLAEGGYRCTQKSK